VEAEVEAEVEVEVCCRTFCRVDVWPACGSERALRPRVVTLGRAREAETGPYRDRTV